jgi:cysteine desulfurase/selenocysteine lyase
MSRDYSADFGPFAGRVWLNCAHQGPLPRLAVSAAHEAVCRKTAPHLIRDEDFLVVPKMLKASLGRLIGAAQEDIILGNSASYGFHVLRNGIRWKVGDEVVVVNGDFPAGVYPWLGLQDDGVRVRFVTPRSTPLTAGDIADGITGSTRLVSVSWVNFFDGSVLDLRSVGELCRARCIVLVVNGSQGIGALEIDVRNEPIDVLVSCGYKWLCGPYGTGFCWIRPELRSQLKSVQTYWLPHAWGEANLATYTMRDAIGAAAFDVFCPANFLNFAPWHSSVDYLLSVGIAHVEAHNQTLVDMFTAGIDRSKYRIATPLDSARRSAILTVSHVERERNSQIQALLAASGIDIALRTGQLRLSPHLYNTVEELGRAAEIMNSLG